MLHAGIDIGSKTIKLVVLDDNFKLMYDSYERHLSNVKETLSYTIRNALTYFPNEKMTIGISGSGGMQVADMCGLEFVQEVVATRLAIDHEIPQTDIAIEIGGEDSKILFITGGEELRMNSTCAGGTGGFVDTIAGMLDINAEKLNFYAHGAQNIYPIASRCAVFAQSDVRPLINEGVSKEDIAASTLDAVVTQCISGLACGRPIKGNVAFLGGPLHFLSALRERFRMRLGLSFENMIVPSEGHLFVAFGAALAAWDNNAVALNTFSEQLDDLDWDRFRTLERLEPLFISEDEYEQFAKEHAGVAPLRGDLSSYEGEVYLGVDSGSEAIKYALIGPDGEVFRTYYKRSAGNVIEAAREMLVELWKHIPLKHDGTPAVRIAHATVTGYGEAYLRKAFAFDSGEVETIAHLKAAQWLVPDVDFLLDIGGQDIKCLYLKDGLVTNVVLNEACSSGCGALLSGMAWSMNVRFDRFLESALYAPLPVDLGMRCTVFMTSRVRHAQKEGASLGDISAGLAYSVVRNAIYKVIRAHDIKDIGNKVVVQGGTFANDAVLRAFEKLYGQQVTRPEIAPFMGAYGAALRAAQQSRHNETSSLLTRKQVETLQFSQTVEVCQKCPNACTLTITEFGDEDGGMGQGLQNKRRFVVGNRCERGGQEEHDRHTDNHAEQSDQSENLFAYRYKRLFSYKPLDVQSAIRGEIGILRALDMYEHYPFWFTFFSELGFRVVLSSRSNHETFNRGADTIPSESLCYPAKLVHGHLIGLLEKKVKLLFLPYILGNNRMDGACPIVASYPLTLMQNVDLIAQSGAQCVSPVINHMWQDGEPSESLRSALAEVVHQVEMACEAGSNTAKIDDAEIERACLKALFEQRSFWQDMKNQGVQALKEIKQGKEKGVILAGRPYHVDPEIHHGIPEVLNSYGFTVLTEDCLPTDVGVHQQGWEYPDRIYAAAEFASVQDDLDFIELHSFGCGPDAFTVDKARRTFSEKGKIFTSLKVDEMVDLAAVKIRIRSMMSVRDQSCENSVTHDREGSEFA